MKRFILVYDKRTGKRLSFSVITPKPRKKRRQTPENQLFFWVFDQLAVIAGLDQVTPENILAVFRRDYLFPVTKKIDPKNFIKSERLPVMIESGGFEELVLRLKRSPRYPKKSKRIIFSVSDLKEKISYWKNPLKKSKSRRFKNPAHKVTRGDSPF